MARNEAETQLTPADAMLRAFTIHNRIHLYLLDAVPAAVWAMTPPGGKADDRGAGGAHPFRAGERRFHRWCEADHKPKAYHDRRISSQGRRSELPLVFYASIPVEFRWLRSVVLH